MDTVFVGLAGGEGAIACPGLIDVAAAQGALAETRRFARDFTDVRESGISSVIRYAGVHYTAAFIVTDAQRKGLPQFLGFGAAREAEKAFAFDHEEGHLVCRGGFGAFNARETEADLYAVLRHFRRFGRKGAGIENIVTTRAVELVFRPDGGDHFTAPALLRMIEDSKRIDFSTLPEDSAPRVAERYAASHAADPAQVARMDASFAPFKKRLGDLARGDMAVLRDLGKSVLNASDAETFKWGALALRALLDGKVVCEGRRILPKGREWVELRHRLDAASRAPRPSQLSAA